MTQDTQMTREAVNRLLEKSNGIVAVSALVRDGRIDPSVATEAILSIRDRPGQRVRLMLVALTDAILAD